MRALVLAILVMGLSAADASAARWSLGANLGLTAVSFNDNPNDYILWGAGAELPHAARHAGITVGDRARDGSLRALLRHGLLSRVTERRVVLGFPALRQLPVQLQQRLDSSLRRRRGGAVP